MAGTANLGVIDAVFDDDYEDPDTNGEPGQTVMKDYMKAIMKRYQYEDSPEFSKKEKKGAERWLKEYLRTHDYWRLPKTCQVAFDKK
jgi:hypothetical protein